MSSHHFVRASELREEEFEYLRDGLSPVEWESLQTLVSDGGEIASKDIAEEHGRHPDSVRRALRRMEELGSTIMPAHLEEIPACEYDGCDPEDHEFSIYFGKARRCENCRYTEQALRNWWGQDLDRGFQ